MSSTSNRGAMFARLLPHVTSRPSIIFNVIVIQAPHCFTKKLRDRAMLRFINYFAKSLKITQGHSKLGYSFLFAFHGNCSSILYHFWDKARYWSKIAIFSYPLHSTLPLRGSPSEYCHPVWCGLWKNWLPDGEKSLRTYLTISTEYRRVTDGQTDRRTDILRQHSLRYAKHLAVKMVQNTAIATSCDLTCISLLC